MTAVFAKFVSLFNPLLFVRSFEYEMNAELGDISCGASEYYSKIAHMHLTYLDIIWHPFIKKNFLSN